jgi:hypothetical protein
MLLSFASTRRGVIDQKVEEDRNLNTFKTIANISEPTIKLVNKELLIFKRYLVDVKDIKCPLHWWGKHENMFLTIGFCVLDKYKK